MATDIVIIVIYSFNQQIFIEYKGFVEGLGYIVENKNLVFVLKNWTKSGKQAIKAWTNK